jgi:hypothetical protein
MKKIRTAGCYIWRQISWPFIIGCIAGGYVIAHWVLWGLPASAQQNLGGNAVSPQASLAATVKTIKAGPGQLMWAACNNGNAGAVYIQMFDTTGAVVLGTTAPKLFLPLASASAGMQWIEATFLNGIKVAVTTTPTGSSAPGATIDCTFGFR